MFILAHLQGLDRKLVTFVFLLICVGINTPIANARSYAIIETDAVDLIVIPADVSEIFIALPSFRVPSVLEALLMMLRMHRV